MVGVYNHFGEFIKQKRINKKITLNTIRSLCAELMPKPSPFAAAGLIVRTAKIYKVSMQAARIRLKELGIINRCSDSSIDYELSFYAAALRKSPFSNSTE